MRKPNLLTKPGQSYYAKHTLLNNNHLTPDYGDPFGPAIEGQSHWFSINRMVSTPTDLQYNTRPYHVDSGKLWESLCGFQGRGLSEDDLTVATLKHCKNGEC